MADEKSKKPDKKGKDPSRVYGTVGQGIAAGLDVAKKSEQKESKDKKKNA